MTVKLRIPKMLHDEMLVDLRRPHAFAFERVGFMYCKQSSLRNGRLLLAYKYRPIEDEQYIQDDTVGARFDSSSVRSAMQTALSDGVSAFHIHLHSHAGAPRFSRVDTQEMQALIPCFVNLCPEGCHGALVLSLDGIIGRIWSVDSPLGEPLSKISVVGERIRFFGCRND
jgi:hypothetical protein